MSIEVSQFLKSAWSRFYVEFEGKALRPTSYVILFAVLSLWPALNCFATVCVGSGKEYETRDSNVYFETGKYTENHTRIEKKMDKVNVKSFQIMENPFLNRFEKSCGDGFHYAHFYAKDRAHVFYEGNVIPEADPKTFQFVNELFAKDKRHVFYRSEKISDMPKSFEILEGHSPDYAFDGEVYFCTNKKMKKNAFRFLDGSREYAKNAYSVFHNGEIVNGADPETFSLYKSFGIAKDKNHVFAGDKIIEHADVNSFQQIDDSILFKDENSLYLAGTRLGQVNPESAHLSESHNYIIDNSSVFKFTRSADGEISVVALAERDPKTFHELSPNWTKDSRHVYYEDMIFPFADPGTFSADGTGFPKDKNYRFADDKKYCKFDPNNLDAISVCRGGF